MNKAGGFFFNIGYFLYSRTRLGLYYHRRNIKIAKDKLKDVRGHHSQVTTFNYGDLQIVPIPMVLDNYAFVVMDKSTNTGVVIDPGDAEPIQAYLSERNITPEALLITHKHWDHCGGSEELKRSYPAIRIYGSAVDQVSGITDPVFDNQRLQFGGLDFRTFVTPGHTSGHMVYVLDGSNYGEVDSIFSGDLLFLSGCGRIFEGNSASMLRSLDWVYTLPGDTKVWPGHEYAKENLKFACHLDPQNLASRDKLNWVTVRRENRLCTCPSTIEEEKRYNPFLRTREKSMSFLLREDKNGADSVPDDCLRARMLEDIRMRKDAYNYKL